MLEKRNIRKYAPQAARKPAPAKMDEGLFSVASKMLIAEGKNPYYKGGLSLRNLDELDQNIASFEHHEALWVADWIDYLGDPQTAASIRAEPANFKRLVHERASELRCVYR